MAGGKALTQARARTSKAPRDDHAPRRCAITPGASALMAVPGCLRDGARVRPAADALYDHAQEQQC